MMDLSSRCLTSTLSATAASSPFDGSTGDMVLQSSDGVTFHCFSQILVAASSVFADMVAVGTANPDPSSSTNHRPLVPMTEDSKTLDTLLRFIYPIPKSSKPRLLEDIPPFFEASLKYMMEYPVSVLKDELLVFARSRPMEVWAIGCRHMLEDVARAGTERMLQYKNLGSYTHVQQFVPIEDFIRTADARGVTAADYYRLQTYYRHRGKVEEGFSLTRPLPRQAQDQLPNDLDILLDFFSSEIVLPDVTCYAADGKPFPVHAGLLCMNSPVLKEKVFEERRHAETLGGDSPNFHLHLTEESPVLAHLLRLCYPGDAHLPTDHNLFLAVLKAAEKYDMERIVDGLYAQWHGVCAARPASAYLAALRHGFQELARVAALKIPPASSSIYIPEMEHAPAIHWQRLKEYWAATRGAVDRVQRVSRNICDTQMLMTLTLRAADTKGEKKEENEQRFMPKHDHKRDGGTCRIQGPDWLRECRNDVLADVRRRLVAHDMPTVEELVRRSIAPTLTEKPWCACCFDVVQEIVRMGTRLRKGMMLELDAVPLII